MKKQWIAAALGLCMAVTLMSGCGTKDGEKAVEQSTEDQRKVSETEKKETVNLFVYSGAGLKKAMEELKTVYEKENPHIKLEINYAGGGKLFAELEASRKGDLFIVGSKKDYKKAQEKNLVRDGVPVADHTPTIIVAKGNPKGIQTVADLAKEGVRVVIADPEAAPIGDRAVKIFKNAGAENVMDNVVTQVENLPAIVAAVDSGNADAGIATLDSVFDNDKLDKVLIPDDINVGMDINASICTDTKYPEEAEAFKAFIVSEKGRKILADHGFMYLRKDER